MNRYDCEATRDLLPLLTRGELTAPQASAVSMHVADCAGCAADESLVQLLQRTAPKAPALLEERVITAVRRRRTGWAPARLALAATVAVAVIGGALALQRTSADLTDDGGALLVFDEGEPATSWAVAEDPLLDAGTTLHLLSLEQLELVLAELDS